MKTLNLVVDSSRCIAERLPQVLRFQERVLLKDLRALIVGCQNLQYSANGDPHSTNARFAPALPGLDSDTIKTWYLSHESILQGNGPWRATTLAPALILFHVGEMMYQK